MNHQSYNPNYEKVYGKKYDSNLDIKEIAKLVRKDIKAAVKAGKLPPLKCGVRISRFSGGQSLSVTVKEVGFQVVNPEFTKGVEEGLNSYTLYHTVGLYTEQAQEALSTLRSIADAYNFDGSDTMTDYFHVNYYSRVEYSSEVRNGAAV